jgi:hypothetical protein
MAVCWYGNRCSGCEGCKPTPSSKKLDKLRKLCASNYNYHDDPQMNEGRSRALREVRAIIEGPDQ